MGAKASRRRTCESTRRSGARSLATAHAERSEETKMTTMGNLPDIVSREEWLAARKQLLLKEKDPPGRAPS